MFKEHFKGLIVSAADVTRGGNSHVPTPISLMAERTGC